MVGDCYWWCYTPTKYLSSFIRSHEDKKASGGCIMDLSLSAIAMLIFGSVVLYGGLAYFLYKALKTNK
jgi:hypothetical protein